MTCRCCGAPLTHEACDLGAQPLANALVPMDAPDDPDPRFPLRVMVCAACGLVQLAETVDPDSLFFDYSYVSAVSLVWRAHVEAFAAMAVDRFGLTANSLVIEAGSNDGTLLNAMPTELARVGMDPTIAKFRGYYAPGVLAIVTD